MALTAESPIYLHFIQNSALVVLALLFTPLCTLIAVLSSFISPCTKIGKQIRHHQQCQKSSASFRPRIVLVTGIGMAKGLAIARAFYQEGHSVVGADFESHNIPVSGRFSKSLRKFYRLPKSTPTDPTAYIDGLISIIKKERAELWISCSGVASALTDGQAAEAVQQLTSCKTIQFGASLTETLHEKHSFIDNTRRLELNTPVTQLITSMKDAMEFLESPKRNEYRSSEHYIIKSVGMDDTIRADMTLLPMISSEETRTHISRLYPSPSRPFVLQQFISGPEYCTHSIVVRGKVLAFTSCKSASILMHYQALLPSSELAQAMLEYTRTYAKKTGREMTGHFSVDFLVDESNPETDLMHRIYPIECNPRAHTAVVLFGDEGRGMIEAYLSALDDLSSDEKKERQICMPSISTGYYWVGHDLVVHFIVPFWNFISLQCTLSSLLEEWRAFAEHLLTWKEGTFVVWDPWPAWWHYCVYWPATFLMVIWTNSWWSKCNVSTNKLFRC